MIWNNTNHKRIKMNYSTIITFLCIGILCVLISIYKQKKEARNIWNAFILMGGIIFLFNAFIEYISISTINNGNTNIVIIVSFMFLLIPVVTLILGLYLMINGLILTKKEGFSLSHSLPTFFGMVAVGGSILFIIYNVTLWSMSAFGIFVLQAVYYVALIVPITFAVFGLFSIMYRLKKKSMDVDFIVVLGCGIRSEQVTPLLRGRLDKAIECYHNGKEKATFIVSGGQGPDEPTSEAYAMKLYLLSQDIPDNKIIMEDQSKTTRENLRFSKKIMKEIKDNYTCLIATSNYHIFRAALISRYIGVNGQSVGGRTASYYAPAAYLREAVAIIFSYKKNILMFAILMVIYAFFVVYYNVPNILF